MGITVTVNPISRVTVGTVNAMTQSAVSETTIFTGAAGASQANSAFNQANLAFSQANAAFGQANSSFSDCSFFLPISLFWEVSREYFTLVPW